MFLFVLGLLFLLVAVGLILVGKIEVEGSSYRDAYTVPLRWFGVIAALLGIVFVGWAGAYSQDPGDAVLIKSPGGSIENVDTTSGWGWTAPWNTTATFDLRRQRLEMTGNGDDANGPAVGVALDGSANAAINEVVIYSLPPDREVLEAIYNEYRNQDNFEEQGLIPVLRSTTQDEAVNYGPYVIKEERSALDTNITTALTERYEEMGATVDAVEIQNISLDESTEERLREVTNRQADVEAAQAELDAVRIEGESERERALAVSDADQIARCGATTRDVTREVSGREIETTQVIPVPNAQCQNRLNEQVLAQRYIDALREIGTSPDGPNTIVVPESINGLLNFGQPQG